MSAQYNILLQKLNLFIKKYYKNQILKGIILALFFYLIFYLTITLLEYFGQFSVNTRTVLFYSLIVSYVIIFIHYIVIPLLRLFNIGKVISTRQAAKIISKHFSNLQDKLLNTLELAENKENTYSKELVLASIDQRISQLKPIPFQNAVDYRINYRYLRYLIIAILIFAGLYFFKPEIIQSGGYRILHHQTHFEPEAPFQYSLLNDTLDVQKGKDYEVKVQLSGEFIPENVSISFGGGAFFMKKESNSIFSYKLKNVNNNIRFYFKAENIQSQTHELNVLPSPVILDFNLTIIPPSYTGAETKIYNNIGDVTVPYGSSLNWEFHTKDIDSLWMRFDSLHWKTAALFEQGFRYKKRITESTEYFISVSNEYFHEPEIVSYNLQVIPDLYPTIDLEIASDSTQQSVYYFHGMISDDYGFKKLLFKYRKTNTNQNYSTIKIPINNNITSQEYFYAFDFNVIELNPEESVEYFFEIFDNDAINGSKSSKTQIQKFKKPSLEELRQMQEKSQEEVQSKLSQSQQLVNELQQDVKDLQHSMLMENTTQWEKMSMMNKISEKQMQLQQMMDELKKENQKKNNMMNTFSEQEEEILRKQEQIQKLLDELLTDEMKKMLEEIKKLQDKFDEKKLQELAEKMDQNYKDLDESLDRNLELLKRFEVEQGIENASDRLKELAEKQKELAEKTKNKEENNSELLDKQNKQAEEFKKLQEDYNQLKDKNKNLKNPMQIDDFEQQMQDIQNKYKEGQQNLQHNKSNKAAKSQQQNSQQLNKLAQQMQQMLAMNMQQQRTENIENLKQILDNLVTFSFDQEDILSKFRGLSRRDPKFSNYLKEQSKLKDDFTIIEDSLSALSHRTPELSSVVNKEISKIHSNFKKIDEIMDSYYYHKANAYQQMIMTSANNLAVMLDDVMQSMMKQSSMGSMGDEQQMKNGNMPGMKQMRQQQESLKNQLEQMLQQMKQGQGQKNSEQMNKQMAQMLARQEMLRKMLNDMQNNSNLQQSTQEILDEINNMMEQSEIDLANKRVNTDLLERQKKISTRMLQAETAENQREIDKKRKSKTGKEYEISNPEKIFEFKKEKDSFKENLNLGQLKLYNYYKNKYKDYLLRINDN